jgi:hypothetical protein
MGWADEPAPEGSVRAASRRSRSLRRAVAGQCCPPPMPRTWPRRSAAQTASRPCLPRPRTPVSSQWPGLWRQERCRSGGRIIEHDWLRAQRDHLRLRCASVLYDGVCPGRVPRPCGRRRRAGQARTRRRRLTVRRLVGQHHGGVGRLVTPHAERRDVHLRARRGDRCADDRHGCGRRRGAPCPAGCRRRS